MFLEENKERIKREYCARQKELPGLFAEVDEKMADCRQEVVLALQYLYTYSPYSDVGNYPFEYFLDFAEHGVKLWKESEEVKKLPEEIFLNYVLCHRVNEEEILPCRSLFYNQLKDRVQGMAPKERMLEVNYWCAENATYQSTDDRTLSALAVYKRGNGRCGEESTFMVNALRSVGIPARQVYAPHWSHCDDNHAWVEMWWHKTWYFTGACEPQPILNRGWFTNASSRAMMIHSRRFDSGVEKALAGRMIGKTGITVMFNELDRYAVVKKAKVHIIDENGSPVPGAQVFFEVLNYAQFFPIAQTITDETGETYLFTGVGSLHIRAELNKQAELCGDGFIDTDREDICTIKLTKKAPKEEWLAYDMTAPHDTPVHTDAPTKEQVLSGDVRLKAAARIRESHMRTFTNPDREAFLTGDTKPGENGELRQAMLDVLTVKDQTDCKYEVLEEHLQYALPYKKQYPHDTFVRYILNPRVEDEILSTYRKKIIQTFGAEEMSKFRGTPAAIWDWITLNICTCPKKEQDSLITLPAASLKLHTASPRSQKVLFVAIARSLGIPARLNPVSGTMEYMAGDTFVPVLPEELSDCHLVLERGADDAWNYFQDWSIARFVEGKYVSLTLSDTLWEDEELHLQLKPGIYRILTANRIPNGSVLTNRYELRLESGEEKKISLMKREADLSDMLLNIDMPDFYVRDCSGKEISGGDLSSSGQHIFFWLEGSREPTIHILNELLGQKEEYAGYQNEMIFIVQSKAMLADKNIAQVLRTFPGIRVFYDDFARNVELLGRRVYVDHEKLPLIIVTSGKLTAAYAESGYNVGTGNMMLRILEEIRNTRE
ncbi:transglutaminase-like domain-containing protein [Clostridium sp. C105KSO13]|uniref:transglutaminase-like domain-containing protein n=1 Tax=Clostridium sp. C105KSO13 TaxID=1776045 RepID=UPI0007406202|nr:transglutaminase-like domain-containing protein [Clostridium sp. C105KSO13]CUX48527.1 Transglutaminase-like superfamily protein [Clostridium sp. C105KSO13]